MKRLLSFLLVFCLPVALHAQVSIRGTVTDQQTGAPVVGATVSIPGTATAATTDQSGAFALRSAAAVSRITVSRAGYISKDVAAASGGEPLVIQLTPTATKLPGVQVVANKPTPSTAVLTAAAWLLALM